MSTQYERIRHFSLPDETVKQLEGLISKQKLAPGERLPSERELIKELGVSRTVLRESMKILAVKGLVSIQPGRGTFVARPTPDIVAKPFDLLLVMENVQYSELLEARVVIEVEIARIAALRAKPENIARMEDFVAEMEATIASSQGFIGPDRAYHEELAAATQNRVLMILMKPIAAALTDFRGTLLEVPGVAQRALFNHKRILKAVKDRDPEQAAAAMRRHLAQVRTDMAKVPGRKGD